MKVSPAETRNRYEAKRMPLRTTMTTSATPGLRRRLEFRVDPLEGLLARGRIHGGGRPGLDLLQEREAELWIGPPGGDAVDRLLLAVLAGGDLDRAGRRL